MKKEIDCNIIIDLLPLYHDKVVSEETSKSVKNHLEACEECNNEYNIISEELPQQEENSTKEKFFKMITGEKKKKLIKLIASVILTTSFIFVVFYTFTQVPIRRVNDSQIGIFCTLHSSSLQRH